MKVIVLNSWNEFDARLRTEMKYNKLAVVRDFKRSIVGPDFKEIDLVKRALLTGTDRGPDASMWNAPGLDHDHDAERTGKKPNEIFYGSRLDLSDQQTKVLLPDGQGGGSYGIADVTKGIDGGPAGDLDHTDAILIYDPRKVIHKMVNEYWFKGDPQDSALCLFQIKDSAPDNG